LAERTVKITATIITLNEERNLERALDSLDCVDEIVIVDSGSTDRTREIACRYGARFIEHTWPGFAAQKNFAAEQADNDWILSIDADEALTEGLSGEIMRLKQEAEAGEMQALPNGYRMPRRAQYLGRWILHSGWYPDAKVRLYDRRHARWTGEYVHESVVVDGAVGALREDLLHYTCDSFSQHLRTLDRYTTLAAQDLLAHGRRASAVRLLLSPPWTFFRTYILQQGFRDGWQGAAISAMAAWYVFLKWGKTMESPKSKAQKASPKSKVQSPKSD
jgi:glycosyltransferase involved in cell wall biosynthesis